MGAGGRACSGWTAAPPGFPVGIPGGWAHPLPRAPTVGTAEAAGGCDPAPRTRDEEHGQQRERAAGFRQPLPPARATAGSAIQTRPAGCKSPGLNPSFREWGRSGRPPPYFFWTGNAVGRATFPGSAGARLRLAGPPRSSRRARRLFVSPRLPSSQTNGCRQEIGRAPGEPGSSAQRGGGATPPPAGSAPTSSGGWDSGKCFDISSEEGT